MANFWLHNGFLQVEGEKMAKSAGNFVTIHELLQDWPGEAIRLNMLMTHYRQPLNWTEAGLREAKRMLDHWYELTADASSEGMLCADTLAAIEDDLNTPKAVSAIHELRQAAAHGSKAAARSLKASAQLLGLLQQDTRAWADWRPPSFRRDDARIASFIDARNAARKAKDFKEADRIRDELAAMGIEVKDAKDPKTGELVTTWEVAR
jgi:cysteinyl-tRNA synthetase